MKALMYMLLAVLVGISCSNSPRQENSAAKSPGSRTLMMAPAYPDIASLSAMLGGGDSTSVALVKDVLSKAQKITELNAFITLAVEDAVKAAAESDRQRATGGELGPLHGIPLVVKDNIHVAGMPNSAGTPALKGFIPQADNAVVARLRAAGAIIIGKTNMHELAFGITSRNAAFGVVRNPWDSGLIPGGSSGGTAVAIAAGIVAAGLGTDTGGSARIPAALTGIVGFRPSTGRYPSVAVTPISHTRDTVGLLARTVADLVLLDDVIVEKTPPLEDIPPDSLRLGVPRGYFYAGIDSETAVVIESVLSRLATSGVQLIEVDIPDIAGLVAQSAFPIALFEVAHDLPAYLEDFATGVSFGELSAQAASPDVQGVLALVSGEDRVSKADYGAAMRAREQLRKNFRGYFTDGQFDAIIFPTTVLPARPIKDSQETVELNGKRVPTFPTYIRNTDPASIAALPAISLPAGLTASGLPVGIEVDGPEQSDRHLLAVAKTLEGIIAFKGRPGVHP